MNFLNNPYVRIILVVMTSIFAGYALRPVPKILDDYFTNSYLFKFVILFVFAFMLNTQYLKNSDLLGYCVLIAVCVLVVLLFFHGIRNYELSFREREEEKNH